MTLTAYLFLALFSATAVELVLDSLGLSLPLVAIVCFYAAAAYGLWGGAICSVIGGASIDFVLGREHPFSVLLLLLVVALAMIWLYRLEASSPLLLCVPGALLPFIVWVPLAIPSWTSTTLWLSRLFDCLSGAMLAAAASAALLPLAAMGLDYLGQRLELPLLADAKERASGTQ